MQFFLPIFGLTILLWRVFGDFGKRRICKLKRYSVPIYFELVNKVVVEVPEGMPFEKIHELALEKFNESGSGFKVITEVAKLHCSN